MMEGWEEVRFGDVVQFPPKIKMKKGESYPFIPMENLDSGIKYVKPIIEKELKGGGAKFEEGDTLFSRITPCLQNGKIAQAKNLKNKPGFGSTEYFVFRGIDNLTDTDFIYYLSKSQWFKGNAENSMVGSSGRQRADAGFVRNLKINLPPLKTQRKIASILSGYDDLIENNLKRIKLLEEKAQQTYEEWFVRFKFPGYENVEIDEESSLPVGWEKKNLGEFIVLNYGKALKADIRVVGLFNVYGSSGIVGTHESALVEGPGIIVGRKGNVGSVFWEVGDFYPIDTVYYISSEISFYFIYYNLKNQNFINNDAAVPGLNRNSAYLKSSFIPSVNILNEFDTRVQNTFDTIHLLQNQNQHLKEARDILLPRLMSGMIDVDGLEVNEQ